MGEHIHLWFNIKNLLHARVKEISTEEKNFIWALKTK